MFLEFYSLHELPFLLGPDPRFLYLSRPHSRAKAYMEWIARFAGGCGVLTGGAGSGKTTLVELLIHNLPRDIAVVQIHQTYFSALEFLHSTLRQLGFSPFRMEKAEAISTIEAVLAARYHARRKVLLVLDEAHEFSGEVLEAMAILSVMESAKEKALRFILTGQPALAEKLNHPELAPLAKQIPATIHLSPLSGAETRAYVQHRLRVAGACDERPIFGRDTYPKIFQHTGGAPRLINRLCGAAMAVAYRNERNTVMSNDVTAAAEVLGWNLSSSAETSDAGQRTIM